MGCRSILVAIGICACSPHRAATSDGTPLPLPDASLCGNGVVDPGEGCDEGALNGTPQGTCSKQCWLGWPSGYQYFPFRALAPLPLQVYTAARNGYDRLAFAFTDFSDTGLQYATFNADGSLRQIISLKVHSAAIAVAPLAGYTYSGPSGLVWIEQAVAGVGGPWLFWATFDSNDVPTVKEIPFPFGDGTRPELVRMGTMRPLIIDQSASGAHDLIISELIGHDDGTVDAPTTRLASAGLFRGRLVAPSIPVGDQVDEFQMPPNTGSVFRIVQFYDDNYAFQSINVRLAFSGDIVSAFGPYQISEFSRGTWPYRVVGGTGWVEGCTAGPGNATGLYSGLTHPHPTAVISDNGDIYTWQFDHSPTQGELVQPFAHVPPGSIINMAWGAVGAGEPLPLWVLEPDGTEVYLPDGDNCDATSPALLPHIEPGTASWTIGWRGPEPGLDGLATNNVLQVIE